MDELLPLLRNLKIKAESFDRWAERVKDALDRDTPKSVDLPELKSLLSEARSKNFPKSDLLKTLENAIEDAEKCASVIRQLDLNKIRTRNSNENRSKLSLEELQLFCEEIDSLACILEEENIMKDLLNKTTLIEKESDHLLHISLSECSLSEVEICVQKCTELCIELPSFYFLNKRLTQLKWVQEVKTIRESSNVPDIDTLKTILNAGLHLQSDELTDKVIIELNKVIMEAEAWEEQAQMLLNKSGPDIIKQAEELIKSAANIDVYLPTENSIMESLNNANEWYKQLQIMDSLEFYPYLSSLEDFVKKSRNFLFQVDDVERLKAVISAANLWKEKTSKIFLKKSCTINLIDALWPRTQFTTIKGKRKNQEDDTCIKSVDQLDPATVVSMFKDAEEREMTAIRNLRSTNSNKSLYTSSDTFCTCQKPVSGLMMQCDLCKDWFHSTCVPLPKIVNSKTNGNYNVLALYVGFKDSKFLCTVCVRTRRPKLESILGLLMSLQKLHTRLPEGEALQCLTERAMNWQDRARTLLNNNEIEAALNKIKLLIQKYTDATAKVKNEKLLNAETKRLHLNVEKLSNSDTASNCTDFSLSGSMFTDNFAKDETNSEICRDEHAYSMHISRIDDSEGILHLTPSIHQLIDELIMEGDLLEVSLDESQQLWQILQAARDPVKDVVIMDFNVS